MSIKELTDEELRAEIAKYTDDPFEVVSARLDARLGSPGVRLELANCFRDLFRVKDSDNWRQIYAANYKLASTLLFGQKRQPINLAYPPQLSPEDTNILDRFKEARVYLFIENLPGAKEQLTQIPIPKGSICDTGKFDNYNQEVLITLGTATYALNKAIPTLEVLTNTTKRTRFCTTFAHNMAEIVRGFVENDREAVLFNGYHIQARTERLLPSPKLPRKESDLEKNIKLLPLKLRQFFSRN